MTNNYIIIEQDKFVLEIKSYLKVFKLYTDKLEHLGVTRDEKIQHFCNLLNDQVDLNNPPLLNVFN